MSIAMAVARRVSRCPYCGSTSLIIVDGHLVCTHCGSVVEDTILYYGLPRTAFAVNDTSKKTLNKRFIEPRLVVDSSYDGIVEALLGLGLSTDKVKAIVSILRENKCVENIITRIGNPSLAAATLLMVYGYLIEGSRYLPSTITWVKTVRRRIVRYFKIIVERCFDGLANTG